MKDKKFYLGMIPGTNAVNLNCWLCGGEGRYTKYDVRGQWCGVPPCNECEVKRVSEKDYYDHMADQARRSDARWNPLRDKIKAEIRAAEPNLEDWQFKAKFDDLYYRRVDRPYEQLRGKQFAGLHPPGRLEAEDFVKEEPL